MNPDSDIVMREGDRDNVQTADAEVLIELFWSIP
jgi:hypothetical protein